MEIKKASNKQIITAFSILSGFIIATIATPFIVYSLKKINLSKINFITNLNDITSTIKEISNEEGTETLAAKDDAIKTEFKKINNKFINEEWIDLNFLESFEHVITLFDKVGNSVTYNFESKEILDDAFDYSNIISANMARNVNICSKCKHCNKNKKLTITYAISDINEINDIYNTLFINPVTAF